MTALNVVASASSRCRKTGGRTETHLYYVALSKRLTPRKVMDTIREHWSLENNLHWPLDVVFREYVARTRKNHAHQNLSFICRMALDILRAHPDTKSPSRKMKHASWSSTFFFSLFSYMR